MEDKRQNLLLLTAAIFAVRVFREPHQPPPIDTPSGLDYAQRERERKAECAALDAQAIMAAVAKLT